MQTKNIISIFLLFICCSCNSGPQKQTQRTKENFDEFYEKFYSDSIFQVSRTSFPLPGSNSDEDNTVPDDFAREFDVKQPESNEYFWTIDKWKFLDRANSNYQVNLDRNDKLVIETIIITNSGFRIERRFDILEDNLWHLTKYDYQNQ